MNGNTERAQCALSRVCIPREKEKKCNVKNKTIVKYLKRVMKKEKKIMPSGPKGGDRPAFWRKEG